MRRRISIMLLALVLALSLSIPAFADDPEQGIYNLNVTDTNVTITPVDASKNKVEKAATNPDGVTGDYYPGAEGFQVEVTDATDGQYVLFVLKGNENAPTAGNLVYINQATPDNGTVTFETFYPTSLSPNTEYYFFLTSESTGFSKASVGSFSYYMDYTPGDVDGDGAVNSDDALFILQITVGTIPNDTTDYIIKAADVDSNGFVNSDDALYVLQLTVGNIKSFDEVSS